MNTNHLCLFAGFAALFASCQNDVVVNLSDSDVNRSEAICFTTFSERTTRGGVESSSNLEYYHSTFAVYGTKQPSNAPDEIQYVFGDIATGEGSYEGDTCVFQSNPDAVLGDWKYSNPRYWDNQADYCFIAYTPVSEGNTLRYCYVDADSQVGAEGNEFRTVSPFILRGTNLQSTASTQEKVKGFTAGIEDEDAGDLDLMISSPNRQAGKTHDKDVNLLFHHILSKLNVTFSKSQSMQNTTVTVKGVRITGLKDQGEYVESRYDGTSDAKVSGWTASAAESEEEYALQYVTPDGQNLNDGEYKSSNTSSVMTFTKGAPYYFIESLVIPQSIEAGQVTLVADYTVTSGDYSEDFNYKLDLYDVAVLRSFFDGYNYTLNFTIDFEAIKFDAVVTEWTWTDITLKKEGHFPFVISSIRTVEDAERCVEYDYFYMTKLSSGSSIYNPEIASDFFNPSLDYNDFGGTAYRWDWNPDEPFVDIWTDAYDAINHACYVIEAVNEMDKTGLDESQLKRLDKALGVAYFTKAYFGLKLLEFYAPVYNSANKEKYGIILVDLYRPGSHSGRSNVEDSYNWVAENANRAEELLADVPGTAGAEELTVDAVHAFQARLALYMGNWDEAIAKATALVDSNKYPLCSNQEEMTGLWKNDSGQECITQFGEYNNSTPDSNDPGYWNYNSSTGQYRPIWILNNWLSVPTSSWFNYPLLYDIGHDLRFATWFRSDMKITTSRGTASLMTMFNKFPGNTTLGDENAHLHKIKPFRIAEQYLIAAEAYAMKGGSDESARKYLNKLGEKRLSEYQAVTATGNDLMEYIRNERAREFIGEGFRWLDLKRWGQGMDKRPDPQLKAIIHTGGSNGRVLNLAISATDHRWLAPVPAEALDANPEIRNQQNPGY